MAVQPVCLGDHAGLPVFRYCDYGTALTRSGPQWLVDVAILRAFDQSVVWIYILLFPGTRGSNQYGPIRTSPVWEKIVAWLVIIFTVLSLLATTALFSYMSEGEPSRIPSEVKQKTTEFF
jgi:hypothetical protein